MERILSERFIKYIKASVTSREKGTARTTIKVVDHWRRNRKRTIRAKAAPNKPALRSSLRELTIPSDKSSIM
ncbi:hypothetical protein ES703_61961 [subsurface metagenome]